MAKKPPERYASAGELARAARRALTMSHRKPAATFLAETQAATATDATVGANPSPPAPRRAAAPVMTNTAHPSAKAALPHKHRLAIITLAISAVAGVLVLIVVTYTNTNTNTDTDTDCNLNASVHDGRNQRGTTGAQDHRRLHHRK
jgi:hypothetical protein